jgi:hypothetical protein
MMGNNNKQIHLLCKFVLALLVLINASMSFAQVVPSVKISQDSTQIGDVIDIQIKLIVPAEIVIKGIDFSPYLSIENKIYASDTVFLDKFADVDVLDFGGWKHSDISQPIDVSKLNIKSENGKQVITNTIKLAIYNMGSFEIPAPQLLAEKEVDVLPTESPTLVVSLPNSVLNQDSLSINPIKDIIREEANLSDYLIYLYILGGVLLMALVGYYFYKNRNKKVEVVEEETPIILLPHEKALNALADLDKMQLWQIGQVKEYQSQLTGIIRQYLEDRYQIAAPEMTTDEISNALRNLDFDQRHTGTLRDILQIADLVKFAKAIPEQDVHSRFMTMAVDFVEKTKMVTT